MEPSTAQTSSSANIKRKRRKKSSASLKEQNKRSLSEGEKYTTPPHNVSRTSSTGSSIMSLDVRCACQFYQCDSLLPERLNYTGVVRPSSRTSNTVVNFRDHEYEPINPPPEELMERGPATARVMDRDVDDFPQRQVTGEESIDNDEGYVAEDNTDETFTAQEMQRTIEDRFFRAAPAKTPSRTENQHQQLHADTPPFKEPQSTTKTPISKTSDPGKSFNETLRLQADKIKSKLRAIKKPNITLPERPKFLSTKLKKPDFKKPNFTMPKLPKPPSINLPSFNLTRKSSNPNDSWRKRQFSTESNVGDSKKKIFDFRTYPRMFDKSKQDKERDVTPPVAEFATVPRVSRKTGPAASTWINKFKDLKHTEEVKKAKERDNEASPVIIRIPLRPDDQIPIEEPSHTRYNEDIDIDDDFVHEEQDIDVPPPLNEEYLKRWKHGEFHEGPLPRVEQYTGKMYPDDYKIEDLNNDMEDIPLPTEGSFEIEVPSTKEEHSSGSLSEHHRGVLEEIDSDEFFLREKGISQDNIEVGKYLSSEIREAFRNPVNALSQLHSEDREYDLEISDQSEPIQNSSRKKPSRKPKRKKTPHVSKERLSFDRESVTEPEEYPKPFQDFKRFAPPTRPKRKSKKNKKKKPFVEEVVPYQETIPIEEQMLSFMPEDYTLDILERSDILPDNILNGDSPLFHEKRFPQNVYENEHMQGIEQPTIKVSDPYYGFEDFEKYIDKPERAPTAPPRKSRSLKSLSASEQGSFNEEIEQPNIEAYRIEHEYIIPTPEPPSRPKRTRSRTHSQSGTSQQEDDHTSRGAESLISDIQIDMVEVVEEPFIKDVRDASGYAVVDKSKYKEPPLPPSRFSTTPSRPKRTKKNKTKINNKFATVPRPTTYDDPPVRPLRNYCTLTTKSSRSVTPNFQDEDKENVDINKNNENEDEPARRLQSGEVIQKMKDRPLPAPPRPPRRPRNGMREVLRDISHERNIPSDMDLNDDKKQIEDIQSELEEEPADDTLLNDILSEIEQQIEPYHHEETVTHGALIIQPLNNSQIVSSYSEFSRIVPNSSGQISIERIIQIDKEPVIEETKGSVKTEKVMTSPEKSIVQPEETIVEIEETITKTEETVVKTEETIVKTEETIVKTEEPIAKIEEESLFDDEETSEIPEEFALLKSPEPQMPEPPIIAEFVESVDEVPTSYRQDSQEVGILKAQKLQVIDLDVDKLRVNELQASKIVVSELDGVSLQVSEINSKSGNLVVSGIELPPQVIQEMLDKLQLTAQEHMSSFVNYSPQSSEATTQTAKPELATQTSEETPQQEAPETINVNVENGKKKKLRLNKYH